MNAQPHNQANHGDSFSVAAPPPLQSCACWRRSPLKLIETMKTFLTISFYLTIMTIGSIGSDFNLALAWQSSVEDIIADMSDKHECGPLVGVPARYSWANRPNLEPLDDLLTTVHTQITAWGQIYIADATQPVLNARVGIKDIRTYVLIQDKWEPIQNSQSINGAYFVSDFRFNGGSDSATRDKQNPKGVDISVRPEATHNFHFWPKDRADFDPSKVDAIMTTAQFKLVRDENLNKNDYDGNGVDDLEQAKFVANIGADLWLPGKSWKWEPDSCDCMFNGVPVRTRQDGCAGNIGMGQGTARFVTTEWTSRFALYVPSGYAKQILSKNPPPLSASHGSARRPAR